MDVRISDEQSMLVDMAAGLAADIADRWSLGSGPTDALRAFDCRDVKLVAEAGLYGLRHGDHDERASWTDVCLVAEQFGRHAAPVPFLGPVLAVEALRSAGLDEAGLGAVLAVDRPATIAVTSDLTEFSDSPYGALAWDCAGSDTVLLLAPDCVQSFRLGRSVALADYSRAVARLGETAPPIDRVGPLDDAARQRLSAMAMAAVAADLLGVMGAALDRAVEHAKSRSQFGSPIGSFQAVQHLLADACVSVEATRSAVWYAGWAVEALPEAEALSAARSAKAFASLTSVEVIEAVMQVFGGMSQTWESICHLLLRRIRVDRLLFGDEQRQYRALGTARPGQGEL